MSSKDFTFHEGEKYIVVKIDDAFEKFFQRTGKNLEDFVKKYFKEFKPGEDIVLYMNDYKNPLIQNIIKNL
jgi:hypothetical protein